VDDRSDAERILEEEQRREKQRVESTLEDVEDFLSDRSEIHKEVKKELSQEIRTQRNRLSRASKQEKPRIRDILESLYRERREEAVSNWRDRESWTEWKLELERELYELESVEDMDFE
jgi:hypothetical protein